jgi:hypothetical protein
VTTGDGSSGDNAGNVAILVNGVQKTASTTYPLNSVVLDECYSNVNELAVRGLTPNAWAGKVMVAFSVGGDYQPVRCLGCTTAGDTASIVVDGDASSGAQAPTQCVSGVTCALAVPNLLPSGSYGFYTGKTKHLSLLYLYRMPTPSPHCC